MKFALRQLLKSPGFTVISLITLALGLGINTTAFTVLNRFLLQRLPYRDIDRVVQVFATSPQANELAQSPGDFFDEREQNTVFERMALYYVNYSASLTEPGHPAQRATTLAVMADFFPVMGIAPFLGRAFNADDEAHHAPVAILSHAYWRNHYAGDPAALGRTLRADGTVVTIVGVMGPDFDDPMLFGVALDLWILDPAGVNRNFREKGWYLAAARLKPGVTIGQAQAEMSAIGAKFAHDFPNTNTGRGLRVVPFPKDSLGDLGRNITWLIMDLALVVLLIACVNLANLQLVRTTGRAREFAIRLALGSPRSRLIGMLLVESLLLSLAGGALGLFIAQWGNSYLAAFFNLKMPLDVRVLSFAFAASALTGAIFGTLPAWIASRADVHATLKQGARGATSDRSRHRLRDGLIIVELAMALTLLTGAGYFVRGLQRLTHHELGWRPENLLVGFYSLSHDRYGEEGDPRPLVFAEHFRADLLALPGVDRVVFSNGTPMFGAGRDSGFVVEGRPPLPRGTEPLAATERITPGYFAAYSIRLVQGRDFADTDRAESPHVVIINQAMAQKFWPGESPLGKRIGGTDPSHPDWSEIVGVVSNITGPFDSRPLGTTFAIYRPWGQSPFRIMTVALHATHDPRPLVEGVRQALAKIEPDVAIPLLTTPEEFMASNLAAFAVVRRLLMEIAALGLLLASVGIYGVIANLASERTQEIGIRMALGASPRSVLWLFLRNGIRLALLGTGIGLLCSVGLMTALNKTMALVPGNDPWVVVIVAALLISVALLACWLPARRATKVNPLIALRAE